MHGRCQKRWNVKPKILLSIIHGVILNKIQYLVQLLWKIWLLVILVILKLHFWTHCQSVRMVVWLKAFQVPYVNRPDDSYVCLISLKSRITIFIVKRFIPEEVLSGQQTCELLNCVNILQGAYHCCQVKELGFSRHIFDITNNFFGLSRSSGVWQVFRYFHPIEEFEPHQLKWTHEIH